MLGTGRGAWPGLAVRSAVLHGLSSVEGCRVLPFSARACPSQDPTVTMAARFILFHFVSFLLSSHAKSLLHSSPSKRGIIVSCPNGVSEGHRDIDISAHSQPGVCVLLALPQAALDLIVL